MNNTYYRTLSTDGKAEIGHIFPDGQIPVQEFTPYFAYLEGEGEQLIFLIPLGALTAEQQEAIFAYVVNKFGCTAAEARREIEGNGHFPVRKDFVIESYDMRLLI